jgi:hypothetical protein
MLVRVVFPTPIFPVMPIWYFFPGDMDMKIVEEMRSYNGWDYISLDGVKNGRSKTSRLKKLLREFHCLNPW